MVMFPTYARRYGNVAADAPSTAENPPAQEAAPVAAPGPPAPPPPVETPTSGRPYPGYRAVLQEVLRKHKAERPDADLTQDEIDDAAKEVRANIPLGDRAKAWRETHETTGSKVGTDLIALFRSEHVRSAERKNQEAALAPINEIRLKMGLEPVGTAYTPELRTALDPVREAYLRRSQEAERVATETRRFGELKTVGVTPETHTPEGIMAYLEGRITDRTKVPRIPVQNGFDVQRVGGQTFIKAAKGYTHITAEKPQGPSDEEKAAMADTKAELDDLRRSRNGIGQTVAELQGEAAGYKEMLDAEMQKPLLTADTPPDAEVRDSKVISDLNAKLSTSKHKMKSLVERDTSLSSREGELRGQLGGKGSRPYPSEYISGAGGVRRGVELPPDLEPQMTDEPLDDPARAVAYINKLLKQGLKRKQIMTLLSQHGELDEEDLAALDNQMQQQGVQ